MSLIADLFVKLGFKSDEFNKGIDQAKHKTSMFGSAIGKIGGMVAGAFAVGAIFSFVKSAVSGYNEIAQANAKLKSVLKSTGEQAGMSFGGVKKLVEDLKGSTLFSGSALTDASALMLTFTKVGKEVFPEAITAAANMSAVMGGDLHGSIIQLGKALNTPTIGLTALRRVGVSFSDEQTQMIKKLAATGHLMEAQKMILAELTTEFGGAANAATKAGTGGVQMLSKQLAELKKVLGEVTVESSVFQDNTNLIGTYLSDLTSIIKDENIPVWQKWLVILEDAAGIDWSNNFDALKAMAEQAKLIKEWGGTDGGESTRAEPIKKKQLTKQEQYTQGIEALKQGILDAEEAGRNADPGQPFVEAAKNIATAKKDLQDYIDTFSNVKENKEQYDKSVESLKVAMNKEQSILAEKLLNDKINKEEYDILSERLAVKQYEKELALARKFKQDISAIEKNIIEERLKIKEQSPKKINVYDQKVTAKYDQVTGLNVNGEKDPNELRIPVSPVGIVGAADKLEQVRQFNDELNGLIASGMNDAAMTFGEGLGALMSGDMNIGEFGASLLGVVGDFISQLGQLFIATAIGMIAFNAGLKSLNPILMLGAGVALVAAGSLVTSFAKKGIGGSNNEGSSSAASGYSGSQSQSTAKEALSGNVVFEVQGNKLVGVLNNVDRRNLNFK